MFLCNLIVPHIFCGILLVLFNTCRGGGPGAVVKAACLESRRSRGRTPLWLSSFKETKCVFTAHSWWFNIAGNLRDREVACSASDRQGSYSESCVRRAVSSHSSHHPQDLLLAVFIRYVHKCGLKSHSFHLNMINYFQIWKARLMSHFIHGNQFNCKFFILKKMFLIAKQVLRSNLDNLYVVFMIDFYSPGCLLSESSRWTLVTLELSYEWKIQLKI